MLLLTYLFRTFVSFFTLTFISFTIQGQIIVVLRPDAAAGKDAFIGDASNDSVNMGTHPEFSAIAGTVISVPHKVRSLLEFDLSAYPDSAMIDSAFLSLYSWFSPSNGQHRISSGSNQSRLSRITTPWEESTVTWNNQPSITTLHEIIIPGTTMPIEHRENIDVTQLIKDMIGDPGGNHGFMMQLVTEAHYRFMIFASSDNADSTLRPKLKIVLKCHASVNNLKKEICYGDSIFVGGSYQKSSGTYRDTFNSRFGCDSITITQLNIKNLSMNIIARNNVLYSSGFGITAFQWLDCNTGLPVPGGTKNYFTPLENGSYSIVGSDGVCSDTSSCFKFTYGGPGRITNPRNILIYPNPFLDTLHISMNKDFEKLEITIIDVLGKSVFSTTFFNNRDITLNLKNLSPGLYFLRTATPEETLIHRIVRC